MVRLVRAAPFALFWNTRKTKRGASQLPTPRLERAAPFALLSAADIRFGLLTAENLATVSENRRVL